MAYELRLLCRTNPDFYFIWAVFIGGGGGLEYFDLLWIIRTGVNPAILDASVGPGCQCWLPV